MNPLSEIAAYLHRIVQAYRDAQVRCAARFSARSDTLFPASSIWASADDLVVMVATDGLILMVNREPSHRWYFTGGPALKLDLAHTRTPLQVRVLLVMAGGNQQPAGIARAVLADEPSTVVWRGDFGAAIEQVTETLPCRRRMHLARYDLSTAETLRRATFGFYGDIVDPAPIPGPLPAELVRNLGFFPADLNSRRYFQWLCVAAIAKPAVQSQAVIQDWAERTVREDIARTFAQPAFGSGDFIAQPSDADIWSRRLDERLDGLSAAEQALERKLGRPAPGSGTDAADVLTGDCALAANTLRQLLSVAPVQNPPRDPGPGEQPMTPPNRRAAEDLLDRAGAIRRLLREAGGR